MEEIIKKIINNKNTIVFILGVLILFEYGIYGFVKIISFTLFLYCIVMVCLIFQMYIWDKVRGFLPFLIVATLSLSVIIIFLKDNSTIEEGDWLTFYGAYLSFIGTFGLGFFIYLKDEKVRLEEKIHKCKLLYSTLENITWQTVRLTRGTKFGKIKYDYNWKDYFYEYETLIKKHDRDLELVIQLIFNNVDNINLALEEGDYKTVLKIQNDYIKRQNYSLNKYNELEAMAIIWENTYYFGKNTVKNRTSWEEQKGVKKLIESYANDYFYVIENWIYNYLIKNNRKSVKDDEIEYMLIEWLLTNDEIKQLEPSTIDKRIIAKIIFTVNLNMDKKSKRITHCWGEINLKTNN
jgi:hypothetical protein